MVYIALGVVALSVSFYIISYGHPATFLSHTWRHRTPEPPKTVTTGQKPRADKEAEQLEGMTGDQANKQPKHELQDTQSDSRSTSPQTTPKARPRTSAAASSQQQQPIPSFALDGAEDDSPAATLLRSDRPNPSPSRSSSHTQQQQQQPISMPPPPLPSSSTARRKPHTTRASPRPPNPAPTLPSARPTASTLLPRPSHASTLRKPPSSTLSPTTSSLPPPSRPSKKILLAPGHSPLDWAALVHTLPPPAHLLKIPPSLLAHHNGRVDPSTGKRKDAWGVWAGRVYNLSPYLDFHPGGKAEILRAAGREEGVVRRLFEGVHPWVSWEGMLGGCLVGVMVGEGEGEGEGEDGWGEEMD
ncbi:MAG: hypothetical protein HETSPECPRED_008421 [Heterodermia speciosa]|uniref:Cytochrome b5 heme-binding domain-containing protein n=1 Tax=Heterodermia speciosa TaxID=116794 RepID=A0A8H3FXK4_9LECA|nr:MAG: hypothetical protein HETSPECPRED_008421 [Heterodermia speciosa]